MHFFLLLNDGILFGPLANSTGAVTDVGLALQTLDFDYAYPMVKLRVLLLWGLRSKQET